MNQRSLEVKWEQPAGTVQCEHCQRSFVDCGCLHGCGVFCTACFTYAHLDPGYARHKYELIQGGDEDAVQRVEQFIAAVWTAAEEAAQPAGADESVSGTANEYSDTGAGQDVYYSQGNWNGQEFEAANHSIEADVASSTYAADIGHEPTQTDELAQQTRESNADLSNGDEFDDSEGSEYETCSEDETDND